MLRRTATRRGQRGMTLTELMIGITIGLVVLAGTLGVLAGHLRTNTDLMRTTRINNELRAAMDMVARDVRRAGFWGNAVAGVWVPGSTGIAANPFAAIDASVAGQFTYRYDVNANGTLDADETFRIQLNAAEGSIEFVQLDAAGAATSTLAVSDPDLTNITGLTFALTDRTATSPCLKPGAGAVAPTPPLIHIRAVAVTLTGQLRADANVVRTLTESVALRNDWIEGSCPL